MSKSISQREAHRLRKLVAELIERERAQKSAWRADFPGGTHFWTATITDARLCGKLDAVSSLGCIMVAKWRWNKENELMLFAINDGAK